MKKPSGLKFLLQRVRLTGCYLIGLLGLRSSDVLLSAYPRSGSTWLRFILCNIISISEGNEEAVDFDRLNATMTEIGVSNLLQPWRYELPRIVKTHRTYLPIFFRMNSIGLIRDPRDVMVSFYHYKKDRQQSFTGTFSEFLQNPAYGLPAWFKHFSSWRSRWDLVVQYESLKENPNAEVRRILSFLNVSYSDNLIAEAIHRSRFERVRDLEEIGGPNGKMRFARSGRTRQWIERFSREDLQFYESLATENQLDIYRRGQIIVPEDTPSSQRVD